jgi:putative membrane protein
VWVFLAALAVVYHRWILTGPGAGPSNPGDEPRPRSFWAGLFLLWLVLDWPVGALGGGYLASAHMVQYLALSLAAPPLLLRGVPAARIRAAARSPTVRRWGRRLFHPALTLGVFALVLCGTHLPAVVDGLMATQAGSFALDVTWLASGLLFWWPLLLPTPGWEPMPPLGRMAYLFGSSVPATLVAMMLVFAEFPQYATYELAPPVAGLEMSPMTDQVVAALLMKFGGGVVIWTLITVLFFRWYRDEEGKGEEGCAELLGPGGRAAGP